MKVLVVGASRGSGAAMVRELAGAGHEVTALARSVPEKPEADVDHVRGDVLDPEALGKAVVGQDAVVVTLGISDNPIGVRLRKRASTPLDVRSAGTAAVVGAMRETGVRRLVVQSTYGIGDTYARLSPTLKVFFSLVIRPQVDDSERQEAVVRGSGLDWTILRPVALHDGPADQPTVVRDDDTVVSMRVSRNQVARAAVTVVAERATVGRTLSISSR